MLNIYVLWHHILSVDTTYASHVTASKLLGSIVCIIIRLADSLTSKGDTKNKGLQLSFLCVSSFFFADSFCHWLPWTLLKKSPTKSDSDLQFWLWKNVLFSFLPRSFVRVIYGFLVVWYDLIEVLRNCF